MKKDKDKGWGYRVRFNKEQIEAVLSVASVLNNKELGNKTIANFGYIVHKLNKIKELNSQTFANKKNG